MKWNYSLTHSNQYTALGNSYNVREVFDSMSTDAKILEAAQSLVNQHKTKQLYALEEKLIPRDIEQAYLIQREYQTQISATQGAISGY